VASPVICLWLLIRDRRFKDNRARAAENNQERINQAKHLDLPGLDLFELTVLVDWNAKEEFIGGRGDL
jgi:hypothetical protein